MIMPAFMIGLVRQYATLTWDFHLLFHPDFRMLQFATSLIALPAIIFLFLPGEESGNRYGPNPRYDETG